MKRTVIIALIATLALLGAGGLVMAGGGDMGRIFIGDDEETLGKPALHDYEEGKCTLPYIYLYEALQGEERERLVSYHREKLSEENAAWIKAKMKEHKCIERSYALARELSDKAIDAVRDDAKLVAIIESMMERAF